MGGSRAYLTRFWTCARRAFWGAISRGTTDGLHLSLNIAAMLISFLALIALTSDTLWGLRVLPPRLLVLGGGPIGCLRRPGRVRGLLPPRSRRGSFR